MNREAASVGGFPFGNYGDGPLRMWPPRTNAIASTRPISTAMAIVHLIAGSYEEAASIGGCFRF